MLKNVKYAHKTFSAMSEQLALVMQQISPPFIELISTWEGVLFVTFSVVDFGAKLTDWVVSGGEMSLDKDLLKLGTGYFLAFGLFRM